MRHFADRRPAAPVPPVRLRSHAALTEHLLSHHNGYGGADFSHSELREAHADAHRDEFSVQTVPHRHEGINPNPPDGR